MTDSVLVLSSYMKPNCSHSKNIYVSLSLRKSLIRQGFFDLQNCVEYIKSKNFSEVQAIAWFLCTRHGNHPGASLVIAQLQSPGQTREAPLLDRTIDLGHL